MALKITQTVTITGTSEIDGQQAAYFSAQVPQGVGNSTISRNITNQVLYDSNRTAVRADEAEFQSKVYAIEDSLLAQQKRGNMENKLMGITAITDVCKQKLRETVWQTLFINDNKLYLLIRKKETNGKKY